MTKTTIVVPGDFISTGAIGRFLGFNISGTFIERELGVAPAMRTGTGNYWAPDDLRKIRAQLIYHIAMQL